MSGPIVLALRLLLALALYIFIGWIFTTLWRDLQKQTAAAASRRTPGISLKIHAGSAVPLTKHFIQPEITIGRDSTCEITTADETVSARHARLTYHHAQWWLEDLNSTNGTRLNGRTVATPTVLTAQDVIECGALMLEVDISVNETISKTRRIPGS